MTESEIKQIGFQIDALKEKVLETIEIERIVYHKNSPRHDQSKPFSRTPCYLDMPIDEIEAVEVIGDHISILVFENDYHKPTFSRMEMNISHVGLSESELKDLIIKEFQENNA